ncbi:MAG: nitroreductase family protein [Sedimentisphaerales bacterium]|jgi:nitroreductase
MNRRTFLKGVPAITILAAAAPSFTEDANTSSGSTRDANTASISTQDLQPITLVKPETDGGKSVLAALKERRTMRNISAEKLPPQMLSNLLWAAFGVNRQSGPSGRVGRTAASASNSQEMDLYVVMPEGVYLYEAAGHRLSPVVAGDMRAKVSAHGRGGAMDKAPVILIYVVDIAKYSKSPFQEPGLKDAEIQKSYYNVATGLIAGNVYLFAASQGLAAWFHNCNKAGLATELKLQPQQRVLYAQTVGYPA